RGSFAPWRLCELFSREYFFKYACKVRFFGGELHGECWLAVLKFGGRKARVLLFDTLWGMASEVIY
ncbi:MAG: hypothetical protein D6730_17610, partial [Bacteroidetes bacterium]